MALTTRNACQARNFKLLRTESTLNKYGYDVCAFLNASEPVQPYFGSWPKGHLSSTPTDSAEQCGSELQSVH